MTTTPPDVAALIERLRSLAGCDARAGAPLGNAMEEAADALQSLSDRLAAKEEACNLLGRIADRERDARTAAEAQLARACEALTEMLALVEAKFERAHEGKCDHDPICQACKDVGCIADKMDRAREAIRSPSDQGSAVQRAPHLQIAINALTQVSELQYSVAAEPLDDAIAIARKALAVIAPERLPPNALISREAPDA
jgi:hypothetical protein